jgi:hypothetical protein
MTTHALSPITLPELHDPLWDSIDSQAANITLAASRGASIGMAYHLLVDGLVQPAPYHDMPVSLPIEAHQTVFVVNAAGEAADVLHKPSAGGPMAASRRWIYCRGYSRSRAMRCWWKIPFIRA